MTRYDNSLREISFRLEGQFNFGHPINHLGAFEQGLVIDSVCVGKGPLISIIKLFQTKGRFEGVWEQGWLLLLTY